MLIMQVGAFAEKSPKKEEVAQGGSFIESSVLKLVAGVPQIIQVNDETYSEIMLEASFGSNTPEISLVAFPKDKNEEPLVFSYEAEVGGNYKAEEPLGQPYNRTIASLSVLEVLDKKYVEVSVNTYFERPQKFRFEGLPAYKNGIVTYSLQLCEPQNVTVSLYSMSGVRIQPSKKIMLGGGTFDLRLKVDNPDMLANQLLFLVADFEKYGAISKTINTLGGAR